MECTQATRGMRRAEEEPELSRSHTEQICAVLLGGGLRWYPYICFPSMARTRSELLAIVEAMLK